MPTQLQNRTGGYFSFRLQEAEEAIVSQLSEKWGEERSRVIARALQMAFDLGSNYQPPVSEGGRSGKPIAYRSSLFEEDVIFPALTVRWSIERGRAVGIALRFAEEWVKANSL